jgi:hypothetical protein
MKEIKQLRNEMLETPGWNKRKSVEIAVFAAEAAMERLTDDELANQVTNIDNIIYPIRATKQWLTDSEEWLTPDSEEWFKIRENNKQTIYDALALEREVYMTEDYSREKKYYTVRASRFTIESVNKLSEKKAAEKAAKAIIAGSMAGGYGNNHIPFAFSEEHYNQELNRLRKQIKSIS